MNKTQESDTETNVNAASVSESVGESETALRLRISQLESQLAAAQGIIRRAENHNEAGRAAIAAARAKEGRT